MSLDLPLRSSLLNSLLVWISLLEIFLLTVDLLLSDSLCNCNSDLDFLARNRSRQRLHLPCFCPIRYYSSSTTTTPHQLPNPQSSHSTLCPCNWRNWVFHLYAIPTKVESLLWPITSSLLDWVGWHRSLWGSLPLSASALALYLALNDDANPLHYSFFIALCLRVALSLRTTATIDT